MPTAPERARPTRSQQVAKRAEWIGHQQTAHVHGYTIPGGLLYVGQGLSAPHRGVEPSLIDPALRINATSPNWTGPDLGYWPAYDTITAASRAAYLSWLAAGRRDPFIPIGFVFLFMYGLERRVLVDIAGDRLLAGELPAIRAEMTALLTVYGPENASFQSFAASFIDAMELMAAEPAAGAVPAPPLLAATKWPTPSLLRLGLGRLAAAGTPVPAEWALAWAWYHPEVFPRTPATRCRDEFSRLFNIRYQEQHGAGLVIRPGAARVQLAYRAASPGLGTAKISKDNLPDVFEQKRPGRTLATLVNAVTDELDPYSRWLGRNPDQAGRLAALALLPGPLLDRDSGEAKRLADWADRHLGEGFVARLPGAELIARWSADTPRLSKAESVPVLQLLEQLGFGVEPDVRFGGPPISGANPAVLFRLTDGTPHAATATYTAAMMLVHLAAAVGAADGHVSYQEIDLLGTHLGAALPLSAAERRRLHAHLMWLAATEIKLTGLKRRLATLTELQRHGIGEVLIAVAAADGVISPDEVSTLFKIYQLLGLDPETVTSRLHASLTTIRPAPATAPVTVRPAGMPEPGFPIPPRPVPAAMPAATPAPPAPAFVLDEATIQVKLAETAAVSALLESIFVESGEATAPPPRPSSPMAANESAGQAAAPEAPPIAGLDAAHSRLLRALAPRERWTIAELEVLAAQQHLMPEGAIDVLNEAAFETAEEPVIEGEEVLIVNQYALQELLQ